MTDAVVVFEAKQASGVVLEQVDGLAESRLGYIGTKVRREDLAEAVVISTPSSVAAGLRIAEGTNVDIAQPSLG